MQNKIAIAMASTAAVAVLGLVGWQGWNTHQLQRQVVELQQQLSSQSTPQAAPAPALGAPVAPAPQQSSPPLQLGQVNPPAPQKGNPLSPPSALDPWGNDDPFAEMERMQQQMHQHMQQLMNGFGMKGMDPLFDLDVFKGGPGFRSSMGFGAGPDFDFKENADNYQLSVTIPQGSNVELNTEVHGRDLTVEGKVTAEQQNDAKGNSFRAQQTRQFAQTLRLPPDADGSRISTQNQNGKVVVTLPKLKSARQSGVASLSHDNAVL